MSQQLALSNSTLQKLQRIANAKGVTPEEWIEAKVSEEASVREELRGEIQKGVDSLDREAGIPREKVFQEISGRAFGKYAHVPGTSEDFAREKQQDIDWEDRRSR